MAVSVFKPLMIALGHKPKWVLEEERREKIKTGALPPPGKKEIAETWNRKFEQEQARRVEQIEKRISLARDFKELLLYPHELFRGKALTNFLEYRERGNWKYLAERLFPVYEKIESIETSASSLCHCIVGTHSWEVYNQEAPKKLDAWIALIDAMIEKDTAELEKISTESGAK